MYDVRKWPVDSALEIYDMGDLMAYDRGRTAWLADCPCSSLEPIQWRRGWQDIEDLLNGVLAYGAGGQLDPKRPRLWRSGWEYAAGSSSH